MSSNVDQSAAFTPGPWFAGRLILADDDDDFGTISIGQQDLSERPNKDAHYEDTIAEVWQNPNLSEDASANANLIAASPRLYAALEALIPYAEQVEDEGPTDAGWKSDELKAALNEAEAALAQVRGEQPA